MRYYKRQIRRNAIIVNDSKNQPFAKATGAFADNVRSNCPGAEEVQKLGATSWVLRQIRG